MDLNSSLDATMLQKMLCLCQVYSISDSILNIILACCTILLHYNWC